MTFRQWLVHVWGWLQMFPTWNELSHTWVGVQFELQQDCLGCGAIRIDPDPMPYTDKEIKTWKEVEQLLDGLDI